MSDENGNYYHPTKNIPPGVIYYIESDGKPKDDANWRAISSTDAWNILSHYKNHHILFDTMISDGVKRGLAFHHGYNWFKFISEKG